MTKSILLLLLVFPVGCNHNTAPDKLSSQNDKKTTIPQNNKSKFKKLIGKVPLNDFAMPHIVAEFSPGGNQGCFIDNNTEEGIVAIYPKGMNRPNRNVSIQVRGQIQVATSAPPSSREDKIFMTYNQKVIIVDSWEYIK